MAEGPAQVVPAETPAAQERRGVAVGHRHGPAGLPEPAEQGLDGEVLAEGPGAEPLYSGLHALFGIGVRLMVEGFHPFVGLYVALHGFPERRALPPAVLAPHLNQQCPPVFHFLLAMVTLLNFQLPLAWFA